MLTKDTTVRINEVKHDVQGFICSLLSSFINTLLKKQTYGLKLFKSI